MSKVELVTDIDEVYSKFIKLSSNEMGKALKTGLTKALNKLKNNTRRYFKASVKGATAYTKWGDRLIDGIRRSKIYRYSDGTYVGLVSITTKKGVRSSSFMLKFFEKGNFRNSPRKTRKGYNRGDIQPTNFFKHSVDASECYFNATMDAEINKAIDKINRSK